MQVGLAVQCRIQVAVLPGVVRHGRGGMGQPVHHLGPLCDVQSGPGEPIVAGLEGLREDVEEGEEGGVVLLLVSGELERWHGDGGGR